MKTYTITESKTQLSALVEEVATTKRRVVIGRAGKPMVQLVPYEPTAAGQRIGGFEGQIQIPEDFKTWSDEEAKAFGMIGE